MGVASRLWREIQMTGVVESSVGRPFNAKPPRRKEAKKGSRFRIGSASAPSRLCVKFPIRNAGVRLLPDAPVDFAFVSHTGNSAIGSNFCQAPFGKKTGNSEGQNSSPSWQGRAAALF